MNTEQPYLAICTNRRLTGQSPSCGGSSAETLAIQLEAALKQQGINLPLRHSDCLGHCQRGPNLRLAPQGQVYSLEGNIDIPRTLAWLKKQLS
jgi:hypothetical protein